MDFFFLPIFCNGYFITNNQNYGGSFLSLWQTVVAHLLKNMQVGLEEHFELLIKV